MNKLLTSVGLAFVACVTLAATSSGPVSAAKPEKVSVCHVDRDTGMVKELSVAASAAAAHARHGDQMAGQGCTPSLPSDPARSLCLSLDGTFARPADDINIWTCSGVAASLQSRMGELTARCLADDGVPGASGNMTTYSVSCAKPLPSDPARSLCLSLDGTFARPADDINIWTCSGVAASLQSRMGELTARCLADDGVPGASGNMTTYSVSCALPL